MTKRTLLLLSLLLPLAGAATLSAAQPTDPCANAGSDAATVSCKERGLADAERRMQQQLQTLRGRYQASPGNRAVLLQHSQEAWTMFREAECKLLTSASASEPGYQVRLLDCLVAMTGKRSAELQALLDSK